MRPSDIAGIAVTSGALYGAGGDRIARLGDGGFEPIASIPGGRFTSIAPHADGLLVADAGNNRIWLVTPVGEVTPFAGCVQPRRLDARARSADGPVAEAMLDAPYAVVSREDGVVTFLEPRDGGFVLRAVADGEVTTVGPIGSPFSRAAAAAPSPAGVFLVDSATPCVAEATLDGRARLVAGSRDEPGATDGPATSARFVRPLALAAAHGLCYIADGVRIRLFDGRVVTTVAGGAPGDADGEGALARFDALTAIAVSSDGEVVVVDAGNESVRRIASGLVVTVYRAARQTGAAALVDVVEAQALARELGAAIVDGDVTTAEEIVERLLADHRARGDARPNRLVQPVSVASARVGRALALEWAVAPDRRRSRLGAYCLWLIRSAEGRDAPGSDAERLAEALARALEAGDLAQADVVVSALHLAFGPRRRRDRLAAARAIAGARLERACRALLASDDPEARRLGLRIAEVGRDVRLTPAMAVIALSQDSLALDALDALSAIWAMPCYTRDQEETLRESLPFTRQRLERIASHPRLHLRARHRLRTLLA